MPELTPELISKIRGAIYKMCRSYGVIPLFEDMANAGLVYAIEQTPAYRPGLASYKYFITDVALKGALKAMHELQGGETRPSFVSEVKDPEGEPVSVYDNLRNESVDPEQEYVQAEQQQALDSIMPELYEKHGKIVTAAVMSYFVGEIPDVPAGMDRRDFLRECKATAATMQELLRAKGFDATVDSSLIPNPIKPQARVTQAMIDEIRALREAGWSQRAVAVKFDIAQAFVNKVAKGFQSRKGKGQVGPRVRSQDLKRIRDEQRASKSMKSNGETNE